jgi:uncharacterized lipoprotein YmbA
MKRYPIPTLCVSLLALLLLGGCSTKSEFYRLQPTVSAPTGSRTLHPHRVLGIGEVQVADYLEKPELVTRLAPTHLEVHDEKRWAGSLAGSIQEVLQQDLSALLPRHTVLRYPWDEPVDDRYRLYVTVDRFDGDANGTVTLAGHWSLADREASRVVTGEKFRYVERGTPGPEGVVRTQSSLLERLSRRIAGKIRRYF